MTDSVYDEIVTAIRFYDMAREESKRTVLCEPHREHQLRAAVDQLGMADVITVRASAACPEGQMLIVDEGAIEAQHQEWLQGLARKPFWFMDEA
jgi:hypothetical protein